MRLEVHRPVLHLDAISIAHVDLTGATMMRDLQAQLCASGTQLVIAGRTAQLTAWLERRGVPAASTGILIYPSKQAALQAYMALERDRPAPASPRHQRPGSGPYRRRLSTITPAPTSATPSHSRGAGRLRAC